MLNRLSPLLFALLAWGAFPCPALTVTSLTCNGRPHPLGIGTNDISFSWAGVASERGVVQSAYQIRVGITAGSADVWDSGLVFTNRQTDVTLPASVPLSSERRYYWQVRVTDGNAVTSDWSEAAWFETGLLTAADWTGAEWITRSVASPDLTQWSNYTATVEFTLHNTAFGVLLRSSADAQNAYMFQINVSGATPVFKPHERNNGTYTVLPTVDLAPFGYSNASLTGTTNTLQFVASGTMITTFLNGVQIHSRTDSTFRRGLVGFRTFGAEAASVHQVQVIQSGGGTLLDSNFPGSENGFTAGSIVNGALYLSGNTDAVYVNAPSSLPLLRGKFVATNTIASARVYASAQGLYELSINGVKAGDQFLAPGWTDYSRRIQSQTYDITGLVQPGPNAIGLALANGWYRGKVGLGWTQAYGTELAGVAKIKLTYTNGATQWFATDLSWKAADGPVVKGDLQDGETYNANLEKPGWDTAAFNDASWTSVGTVANVSSRLVPQPDEPIRAITVLTASNRTQPVTGKWLYDLGQNMVGVPRLQLTGTNGQTITIRHGEEIYRTGAQAGQLYTENLRTAKATDTYTFATNGTVVYQPRFTQHGFRYIEISGVTTPPEPNAVQGVVLSSALPGGGDLQTSHPLLNQLVSNIRWGQRGNFLSIPTDTPARDERLGWTGDINVFAPAAARYLDTRAFLTKWMTDVRDAQKVSGNIPAVVPRPLGQFDDTGVGWADAVITVPYSVWRATGDKQILRANWTAMKTFYSFVSNSAAADGDLLEQGRSNWFSGDWLSLESGAYRLEEHKVIATAYFAENTRMMAEMAAVLGEPALASAWTALVPQIRAAFVAAYRNPDGSIYTSSQTAYAIALGLDMISDPAQREQTAGRFIAKLAADNYHLKTGFLGTPWLLPALSEIGRDDLAMRLLRNEDYPSWGFPISIGATTMWERWNSIQPDLTFGPVDMNSFNHYAYGAVGDWMFGNLGGIQALQPGYQQARIAPLVEASGLTNASCFQQTPFGRLATAWSIASNTCVLTVEIPVNTTATVHVPAKDGTTVYEGAVPAETAVGVQFLGTTNDTAVYLVGSGTYVFTSELNAPPLFAGNFGFETPGVSSFQYNPAGGSWTFTAQSGSNGSGLTPNGTLFNSSNPDAPEGVQVAFLQGLATIAQSLSGFLPGANYAVTFAAAQRAGQFQQSRQTWDVRVDGVTIASYSPPATATNYVDYTASFTASAAAHTLAFVGTDLFGGDNTVFLDDVRIALAPSLTPVQLGFQITNSPAGNQIQFTWPADHTGWRLQMQTNGLGGSWVDVRDAHLLNTVALQMTYSSAFFRLVYP